MAKLNKWSMDYGVITHNYHSIKVIKKGKKYNYQFFDRNQKIISDLEGKAPLSITSRHSVGKKIMEIINAAVEKGSVDKDKTSKSFKSILNDLNDYLDNYEVALQLIERAEQKEKEVKELEDIQKAMSWFEGFDEPLIWLASVVDWMTAGERANILRTFFAYCSQIILRNPISVIGLGEGSSGKGHVMKVAKSLCPQEYFLFEKKPTKASMFHRSQEDTHYYDGKIVCYGDLGGENDQDEVRETKDLLKEMQTDGFVNRPITLSSDDGFEVVDLELYGFPALDFQTIPNYNADDQELSRSILITPRTDNRKSFFEMKHLLELVGSPISEKQENIKENITEKIPAVVRGLRKKFEDIEIINPYTRNIENFIGDTAYFKRDYDKYNAILKVISVFNYNHKRIHNINGNEYLFVDKYDLALFFTLFEEQQESISSNLSPVANEIFKDLDENYEEFYVEVEADHPDEDGISVNEYFELGNVKLGKRSLRKYFQELNLGGYVKIVGKQGNGNLYAPVSKEHSVSEMDLSLSALTVKQFCAAYGDDVCASIQEDLTPVNCSIFNQHDMVDKPYWSRFA